MTVPCKLFEIITTRNLQLLTSSKLLTVTISGQKERGRFYPERNRIPNIVLAEAAVRRCFSK